MVEQFHQRHQRHPSLIVITPVACLALAIKNSLAPEWLGIPVRCRAISADEGSIAAEATTLGVTLVPEKASARLVCLDLHTASM